MKIFILILLTVIALLYIISNILEGWLLILQHQTKKEQRQLLNALSNMNAKTGFRDKNKTPIKIGDKTRLVLSDGEIREFDVCYKTVIRTVKCHPDFDDEYAKVAITGVVFNWNGFDLFPCVDAEGNLDTSKMEVISTKSREKGGFQQWLKSIKASKDRE